MAERVEGRPGGGWVLCSLDGPLASRVEPSNLSSQGRREQHHIATVGETILPSQKLHIPLPYRSQLPPKFYWWFFQTVPGREWGCMWDLGDLSAALCLHLPTDTSLFVAALVSF